MYLSLKIFFDFKAPLYSEYKRKIQDINGADAKNRIPKQKKLKSVLCWFKKNIFFIDFENFINI